MAYYYRPIGFNQIVDLSNDREYIGAVGSLNVTSPFVESVQFHLNDETKTEIASILQNLKLRNTIRGLNDLVEDTNDPKITFQVYNKQDLDQLVIFSFGREFLTISSFRDSSSYKKGDYSFKIIKNPDFNRIYEMIIMDQLEGSLPQHYYNLLERYRTK